MFKRSSLLQCLLMLKFASWLANLLQLDEFQNIFGWGIEWQHLSMLNLSLCKALLYIYIYMGSVKRSFMNDSKSKCKEYSSHARLWCGSNSHERETGLWNAICHSSSAVGRKWANFPSFISPDLSMSNDNVLHKGRALLKDERWQVGGGQGCLSWAASALTLQQPVSSDSQCHTSRLSHQKDKNHLGNTNVQPMQHQQHRQRQTISHQQIPPTGRV